MAFPANWDEISVHVAQNVYMLMDYPIKRRVPGESAIDQRLIQLGFKVTF